MSFKRILAVAMLVLAFALCASAAEFTTGTDAVYFVSNSTGSDSNAGTSAAAPLKTLGKANAYLREVGGGTIVICGEVAISSSYAPSSVGGAVLYTSKYNGVDYSVTKGASLNISANIAFNNDTYFENITMEFATSGVTISARCNNLAFGYGVKTVNVNNTENFNYPVIVGGWNNPSTLSGSSNDNDYGVHVYSGDWYGIYGGHRRTSATNPVSNLGGNVAVVIKGGTFQNIISATGMNVHSGNIYLEISGGTFNGAIVPIRRLGTMPTDTTQITDAEFTANLLVRISGGTFNGRFRLAESTVETTGVTKMPLGDATVVVTGGTYNYEDFVGYGVVGSVLLKYNPTVLANTAIKGFPLKTTVTATSSSAEEKASFANPIGTLADPYVIEKDGLYYYCFSSGVTIDGVGYAGVKVAVHENLPFGELSTQRRQVFNASMTDIANAKYNYWAPEIHYFDAATVGADNAGWYIYVAADDGDNKHHRMYVLRATDPENALSDYEMVGQITDSTNKWAIDGTVMVYGGKLYFVWSGWEGDVNGYQDIYIAQMSNPWTISSSRVLLSRPEYDWEMHGSPEINEGPQILTAPDGTVHIIYSASPSFSEYYCYGALTLTGTNPLNKASWYKSPTTLFSSGNGMYGTGHGSFVQDEDGAWWMYYHANSSLTVPEGSSWWAERSTYLKPFSFKTKTVNGKSVSYPNFGTPIALDTIQTISVDTADYHASGDHHYSLALTEVDGTVTEVYRTCYICGAHEVVSVTFAEKPVFTLESTTNSVKIAWTKINGVDGYRIYRRDAGDDTKYEYLAEIDASQNTYTDANLESGTHYRYLMHAYRLDVNGGYQHIATGGKAVYTALEAPTVSAEQTDANAITVTIGAVKNATEYVIYRSVDLPVFEEYVTVSEPLYVDTDVEAGNDYGYKVMAKSANGESAFSAAVSVTAVVMGAKLETVTSGELFEDVNARANGASVTVYKTVVSNDTNELIISDDIPLAKYIYSVHGDYIVPAKEYERPDEEHYMITFMHGGADAYIFSETEIVTYGDVTADGEISLLDVIRTLKFIADSKTNMDIAASDINYDLKTNLSDVLEILHGAID